MQLRYLFIASFIIFYSSLFSQNLINNPSFEDYRSCPKSLGHFNEYVSAWTTPTNGSADYFNACSEYLNVPHNYQGYQDAKFGKGYAGIYAYTKPSIFQPIQSYREYLTSALINPLVKGQKYIVSFYINLADQSRYSVKNIDVLFTSKLYGSGLSSNISKQKMEDRKLKNKFHLIEIENTNYYTDKDNWILISQEFISTGIEKFIIIGNFKNNITSEPLKVKPFFSKKMAYYYIDMISLELAGEVSNNKHSTRSIIKKPKIIFN